MRQKAFNFIADFYDANIKFRETKYDVSEKLMNVTASPPIHPKEIELCEQVEKLAQAYIDIRAPGKGYRRSNTLFRAVYKCRSIWEYVKTYGLTNPEWSLLNSLANKILPDDLAAAGIVREGQLRYVIHHIQHVPHVRQ